jgi:hypothetical protein
MKKYIFEIQDNFLPVGGYMGDAFSLEGEKIAQAIAADILNERNYREHLASLEGDVFAWIDSLGLYVRAVLFRWLNVAEACPLGVFASLGYDAGEAWTICQEIDEKTREALASSE